MPTALQQFQAKGLREKRGAVKKKLEDLGTKIRAEERAMSSEETTSFEALKTEWSALSDQIAKTEAAMSDLDAIVSGGGEPPADPAAGGGENGKKRKPGQEDRGIPRGGDGGNPEQLAADLRIARQAWARCQYGIPLTRAHVEACKRSGFNPKAKTMSFRLGDPRSRAQRMQQRALTVTTSGGGYTIAQDYSYELEQKLVDFSAVRGICREEQTENGADLPWPTEDDTSNTGELLAINTEVAYADPTFGSITLGAYKFSSKGVIVPNELIQDSAFDVESMVFGEIGTRIGRIQAGYFTTGTGSSQPKGVVACSALGVTTALAAAFTADELTRLAHSLDPAYRKAPGVGYMMNDDVIAYALMLKDSNGRPLLRESYREGVGGGLQLMCNGFPIYPNLKMTGLTSNVPVTGAKHVLFGDYKKFIVRDAGTVRVKRLDERWAEKDQVGFVGFLRSDSNCVNTSAIRHMIQA